MPHTHIQFESILEPGLTIAPNGYELSILWDRGLNLKERSKTVYLIYKYLFVAPILEILGLFAMVRFGDYSASDLKNLAPILIMLTLSPVALWLVFRYLLTTIEIRAQKSALKVWPHFLKPFFSKNVSATDFAKIFARENVINRKTRAYDLVAVLNSQKTLTIFSNYANQEVSERAAQALNKYYGLD